jgi:hypothetical protein
VPFGRLETEAGVGPYAVVVGLLVAGVMLHTASNCTLRAKFLQN